jgi:hypothetical protein
LIDEDVDLDLLFQIPQKDSRNMRGIETNCKLLKVKTMEERESNQPAQGGRRGPFIDPPPRNMAVARFLGRIISPQGKNPPKNPPPLLGAAPKSP